MEMIFKFSVDKINETFKNKNPCCRSWPQTTTRRLGKMTRSTDNEGEKCENSMFSNKVGSQEEVRKHGDYFETKGPGGLGVVRVYKGNTVSEEIRKAKAEGKARPIPNINRLLRGSTLVIMISLMMVTCFIPVTLCWEWRFRFHGFRISKSQTYGVISERLSIYPILT